eukprot:919631-Pyramimonas_sp.AAC.1
MGKLAAEPSDSATPSKNLRPHREMISLGASYDDDLIIRTARSSAPRDWDGNAIDHGVKVHAQVVERAVSSRGNDGTMPLLCSIQRTVRKRIGDLGSPRE